MFPKLIGAGLFYTGILRVRRHCVLGRLVGNMLLASANARFAYCISSKGDSNFLPFVFVCSSTLRVLHAARYCCVAYKPMLMLNRTYCCSSFFFFSAVFSLVDDVCVPKYAEKMWRGCLEDEQDIPRTPCFFAGCTVIPIEQGLVSVQNCSIPRRGVFLCDVVMCEGNNTRMPSLDAHRR